MDTGVIAINISSTIGYGFVSAFTDDYPDEAGARLDSAAATEDSAPAEPRLWLFGSACNRCPHLPKTPQGTGLQHCFGFQSMPPPTRRVASATCAHASTHRVLIGARNLAVMT